MHNIQLFIQDYEIELNESVVFSITKTWEDLSNPTVINNDWSKTVEIPFTNRNNQIFGHIYKADKVVVTGGTENVGVYFNPYLKLSMRLLYNDMLLMFGYAKMNSIKQKDGVGTYNITLNGELGKVLQEMKKITFDATAYDEGSGSTYYIDGSKYVDEYINQEIVASSWNSTGQSSSGLVEKYVYAINPQTGERIKTINMNWRLNDIIGFAPNNSFNDGFEYDTYQQTQYSSGLFTDALGSGFTEDTGMQPDSVIPDGLLPREIGEYRSYLQLPFIYFNKLFQVFQVKAQEVTGYQFDLDSSWFNVNNPYWYKTVFMLKMFNNNKGNEMINNYSGKTDTNMSWSRNTGGVPYSTVLSLGYGFNAIAERTPRLNNDKFYIETYDNTDVQALNLTFYITGEMNHGTDMLFSKNNAFLFYINFVGENGYAVSRDVIVYREDTDNADVLAAVASVTENGGALCPISYNNRYATSQTGLTGTSYTYGWRVFATIDNAASLIKKDYGEYITINTTARWLNDSAVFGAAGTTSEHCCVSDAKLVFNFSISQDTFNSNSYFKLNDLWNNERGIFDEILKYCKMYRIFIDVDYNNKKIRFVPSNKYFSAYTIEDWTSKVDYGKDYTIKPITFEDKYVLFNYDDDETKMGQAYTEKFGYKYGEKRLITEYNFNEETNELFEGIKVSEVKTDNVLSWTNIYDNHKIAYSFPAEQYVYSKDDDNKYVDIFGTYFFHNGRASFDTQANLCMRDVYVSDDTLFQQTNNTYFYTQMNDVMTKRTTYPLLDIVNGTNLCIFNTPMESWTYRNNYNNTNGIYYNFWKKYIEERYNIQNKLLTCYIKLSPLDYHNFRFNKFIKIDNQLYMVNKIYDYNAQSLEPTKVDLVTIQDVRGYTTNNYNN